MKLTALFAGTCTLAICAVSPAYGQDAAPTETNAEDSNDIIVTATRRAESLQDVPVAVTAISGAALDNVGVFSVETLAQVAPSITFTQSTNDQNNSVNIRGVGTSVFSQGVESSVSIVIDDVVMARQAVGFQDLADIARVEVLRGPQSTLFGKNASAGVLSVTTLDPTERLSGSVDGAIAEGGEYTLRGTLSGRIGGDFSGRITGYYRSFDGHIDNVGDGRDLNGYENWGVRGKIQFEPDADFRFTLIADYRESAQDCCIYVARDTRGVTGAGANGQLDRLLSPIVAGPENAQSNVNAPVFNNSDQFGISGKAEIDFGDGYSLTSISAYRTYNFANNIDVDQLPFDEPTPGFITFDINGGTTVISQMSQEVRLVSPQGPPIDFVLGGFAFILDLDRTFQRRFEIALPAGAVRRINQSISFDSAVSTTNLALFGSTNIYLSDQTVLFGGARVINEKLEYRINRDPANVLVAGDRPFGGPLGIRANLTGDTQDTAFTGDVGIRHEFNSDLNVYARYARGYKGRAIDTEVGAPPNVQPIEAETSDAFEFGIKSELFDDDLTLNLAVFQTEFDNFQEQASVLVQNQAQLLVAETRLTNVGSVRTRGVELEALFTPSEYTFVQAGLSWTDATITDFTDAPCYFGQNAAAGCVPVTLDTRGTPATTDDIIVNLQDLSGGRLPNAPEWRLTGMVRQKIPVGASFVPFVQVSGSWQSEVNFSLTGDPRTVQGAYAVVNLAAGIEAENSSWSATVVVNNAFDQFYASNVFADPLYPGVLSQYVPRDFARYFGARVRFSF